MIKMLYMTDAHGSEKHYSDIFNFAVEQDLKLIHIGADILPKGRGLVEKQKIFIKKYLREFYRKCSDKDIKVLAFFGNDDVYTNKSLFKKYGTLLDEKPFELGGYEFKAYGFVPDLPFSLKMACKIDHTGWVCPEGYIGYPVDVNSAGDLCEIKNIKEYFQKKGTIEEDLKNISVTNKTIMAIHAPPWAINLDVCGDGRRVGSKAVYDFILEKQPLICFSGHIHESYSVTGVWKDCIGKTLVIQPGQKTNVTVFALVEIFDGLVNAQMISIPH